MRGRIVLVHNIISPYKTLLFAELSRRIPEVHVVFIARTESNRQWAIDEALAFSHEVLFKEKALDDIGAVQQFTAMLSALRRLRPDVCIVGGYSYPAYWAAFL